MEDPDNTEFNKFTVFYANQLLEEYEDFIEIAMVKMQNQIEANFENDIVNLLNEGYPADELTSDYSSYDMFGKLDEFYTDDSDYMANPDDLLQLSIKDFINLQSN